MAQSGPPPSRLCALFELGSRAVGEKVRFLGCITHYNTATALLTLHSHPSTTSTSSTSHHTALVDLTLLLSSTPLPPTNIGEWVNVIGYITAQSSSPSLPQRAGPGDGRKGGTEGRGQGKGNGGREAKGEHSHTTSTSIQALLLWSAGSVDVQEYEQVLSSLKAES